MLFSAISPFGPIFGKELKTASRRRRNYLLRVVYLFALLLFLLLAYTITRNEGGRGVAGRMQQHEQLGWIFFMFFSMFTVIAMGLVGPVLTSTAINSERLHKTLHVLLMTPLTAWQIVSGKLFSRLLTAITLIGLSLPVLALVRLLGGVELQQMFGVICLCIVTAMTTAALGLLMSILLQRAYAVILLSYLVLGIVYVFAPVMLMAYLAASGRVAGMQWMSHISSANPFWCCAMIGSGQTRIVSANWVPCVCIHIAATAVMLTVSAILVRRFARRENDGGAMPLSPVIAAPVLPAIASDLPTAPPLIPYAEPTTVSHRVGKERTVSDNPVLWRELRRPLMARRWQRATGIIIGAIILALSYGAGWANDALKDRDFHMVFAVVFHVLVMLLTCVLAATAIAQEKEGDTWTVLLASPLTGTTIVLGKTIGVMRRLLWPMALIAAHFVIFTLGGVVDPAALLLTLWVIVTFNLIWLAAGIFLSLQFRKVTIAVIVCLALPVALYGALSLVVGVLDSALDLHGDLWGQVSWYMPFFFLVEAIDKMGRTGNDLCSLPGLSDTRVPYGVFAAVAFFSGLAQAILAAGMLWFTANHFDRIVGRAPQREPMTRTVRQPSANFAPGAT